MKKAKRPKKNKSFKSKLGKVLIKFFLIGLALLSLFISSIYFGFWGQLPTTEALQNLTTQEATRFTDRNGKTIAKIYQFNRELIEIKQLPQHLLDALIATEDVRFYEHGGVDTRSLMRVLFKTILAGDDSSGGGSTITLQLAKNIYGRDDFGIFSMPVNKIKEAFVANRIESIYTKEKILELYLNTVPFSGNTYGIESAAKKFFSKPASDLTLAESATLVGTLKANHSYNPRLFPERSQLRRDVVIKQMLNYSYINQAEANKVLQQNLSINYNNASTTGSYFLKERLIAETNLILNELNTDQNSKFNLKTSGLTVETTIDAEMQSIFETSLQQHLKKIQLLFEKEYGHQKPWEEKSTWMPVLKSTKIYKKLAKNGLSETEILKQLSTTQATEFYDGKDFKVKQSSTLDSLQYHLKFLNAASFNINPKTGEILSYVGGGDYNLSQFDVIKFAKRQVGSTFKPLVYASGLESGLEPCSYISGKAITYTDYEGWTPTNASNKETDEHINYSLKFALANSLNTVSVKVLEKAGIKNTINLGRKFGIESEIPNKPSIALGAVNLSFEELAKLYSGIATDHIPQQLYLIKSIKKGNEVLYVTPETKPKLSPLDNEKRLKLLAMLTEVVKSGTAKSISRDYGISGDIAGKTGTTQNNKDGWFIGITPALISINWMGHNRQSIGFKSTRLGQGAVTALPIFASAYSKLVSIQPNYKSLQFRGLDQSIYNELDCEPSQKDGFFKRLFKKKEDEKDFKESGEENQEKKKKGGFWSIFKSKDKS